MGRKRMMAYPTSPSPASSSHLPGRGARADASEHQLEKLEFALAVALTRGDTTRTAWLRDQIASLGGNHEEPGT
jgi:protein-arginine kinase activator protein McsA